MKDLLLAREPPWHRVSPVVINTIIESVTDKGLLVASDLTCPRHVRLDRDLGHAGGTGEEFRAGRQRLAGAT